MGPHILGNMKQLVIENGTLKITFETSPLKPGKVTVTCLDYNSRSCYETRLAAVVAPYKDFGFDLEVSRTIVATSKRRL